MRTKIIILISVIFCVKDLLSQNIKTIDIHFKNSNGVYGKVKIATKPKMVLGGTTYLEVQLKSLEISGIENGSESFEKDDLANFGISFPLNVSKNAFLNFNGVACIYHSSFTTTPCTSFTSKESLHLGALGVVHVEIDFNDYVKEKHNEIWKKEKINIWEKHGYVKDLYINGDVKGDEINKVIIALNKFKKEELDYENIKNDLKKYDKINGTVSEYSEGLNKLNKAKSIYKKKEQTAFFNELEKELNWRLKLAKEDQEKREFDNLKQQFDDLSKEGKTQNEYEDALKLIESSMLKFKDQNYQNELAQFKKNIENQLNKQKNTDNNSKNNVTQNKNNINSNNKKEEPKKEKKKTIIRYSPEQLARINSQIAYQNNVSQYRAKGLDYNSAHRMAQNDSKIEAMDKIGKQVGKQLGNMVVNILEERDRKIEERENKHYGHVKYVKNYAEAIKKNNRIFLNEIKKMPLFDNDSQNIDDIKIEILYLINTLGNYQYSYYYNNADVIIEKEILDAYFEGNILKIEYKEKCITSSMEYVNLISKYSDSPILFDLHTITEINFENNETNDFHRIKWTNGVGIPNTNSLIISNEFYKELKKITKKEYLKPYSYGYDYISSSEINRKMDKLRDLIKNENEDLILEELNLHLNKKDFKKALELSEIAKKETGRLSLKNRIARLKIYHDSKDWLVAKKEYEEIITYSKPDIQTLNSLKKYYDNIKKNESAALLAEKKFFNAKAKELKPIFEKQLDQFNKIYISGSPSSKSPLFQLKSSMGITNSESEKSYLLFDSDNYMIITIPSVNALSLLDLDKVSFSTYDAGRYANNVVHYENVKTSYGKENFKFRRSDKYNNVFIGGNGDEMLWTGEQYTQFDKVLYYYAVNNGLRVDISIFDSSDVNKNYHNPYVENGKLIKTIDYRLVTDPTLKKRLQSLGFIDRPSSDRENLNLLKIEVKSTGKTNMLLSCKDITYTMDKKISGRYTYNNEKYKGEHLYFKSKVKRKMYGRKLVTTNKTRVIDVLNDTYYTDGKSFRMVFELANTALGDEKPLGELYTWNAVSVNWIPFLSGLSTAKVTEAPIENSEINTDNKNNSTSKTNTIYPIFARGEKDYQIYIQNNLKYPKDAIAQGLMGKVEVSFVISKTGKVTDVKVVKSVHPILDAEAVRLISSMPDWKPASQNGAPISMRIAKPINFILH